MRNIVTLSTPVMLSVNPLISSIAGKKKSSSRDEIRILFVLAWEVVRGFV